MTPEPLTFKTPHEISDRIVVIRGLKVILDSDLAELYGVATKRLNEKVRRHSERFPPDFMFLLSTEEWNSLRSQIATPKPARRPYRRFLPYVFTEAGALMAAGLLKSPLAIEMSINLARATVIW
jgi:hypothetical protein